MRLENDRNSATLKTEYETEKRSSNSSDLTFKRSRLQLKESLNMNFNGSVYHPKFLDFGINVELAPQQQKEKSELSLEESGFRNSLLTQYGFNVNLLKEKPTSLSLFSNNHHSEENSDFFERQTVDQKAEGGNARFKNKYIPITAYFNNSHREILRAFRPDQSSDDQILNIRMDPAKMVLGKFNIEYDRNEFVRDESSTTTEGTSDQINISNSRGWGDSEEKKLFSRIFYRSLTGTNELEDLIVDEAFRIQHSDRLETFYRYSFSDQSVPSVSVRDHNIEVGLRHQLYESLVSAFKVNGEFKDSNTLNQRVEGASLEEDYQKHIGPSILRLGWGYKYEQERRRAEDSIINIVNENHTLIDGAVTLLNETNVDVSTIVVTNALGITVYIKNLDYQILELSSGSIRLQRIPGGSIHNGDTVLVDYIFRLDPLLSFTTVQDNYKLSLGFFEDSLRFYYQLRRQGHPKQEGGQVTILENFDDTIMGYEWNWQSGGLSTEYENYDSNLSPYQALRFRESAGWPLSSQSRLDLYAFQNFISFEEYNQNNFEFRGDYTHRLSPSAVLNLESGYRLQEGNGTDLENYTSKIKYRLDFRAFSLETRYEYQREIFLGRFRQNHSFFSTFNRDF